MSDFITVTSSNPCKICGKKDWCFRSSDGEVHGCRRVSGGIHRVDSSGGDYWLYFEEDKWERKNEQARNY